MSRREALLDQSSSRPGSAAAALTRTHYEKELHLTAARHPPGERPELEFRSLVDWLKRQRTCILLEHLVTGSGAAERLLSESPHVAFQAGAVLYHQNDPNPNEGYIILDGAVSLHSKDVSSMDEAEGYLGSVHHAVAAGSKGQKDTPLLPLLSKKQTETEDSAMAAMSGLLGESSPQPSRRRKLSLLRSLTMGDIPLSAKGELPHMELGSSNSATPEPSSGGAGGHVQTVARSDVTMDLEDETKAELEHGFKLETLAEGHSFGEVALLRPEQPRSFTARAESDVELLVIAYDQLKEFSDDESIKALDEKIQLLELNSVFQKWRWMGLAQLASHMTEVEVEMEKLVARQHGPVSTVYIIKAGELRIRDDVRKEATTTGMTRAGSSERLQLPPVLGNEVRPPPRHHAFKFQQAKDIAVLGTGDVYGAYEVARSIGNYAFSAQTLSHCELYEIPARKFVSVVKKYSRRSLAELADVSAKRFGLALRVRKRSGSCPDLSQLIRAQSPQLTRSGIKLPPISLSAKTGPRTPLQGVTQSMPSSPVLSRTSSPIGSPMSTPGRMTPGRSTPGISTPARSASGRSTPAKTASGRSTPARAASPQLSSMSGRASPKLPDIRTSSRPGSPLTTQRQGKSPHNPEQAFFTQQVSNLLQADGACTVTVPTVIKRSPNSPATRRKAAGMFDHVQSGSRSSPTPAQQAGSPLLQRKAW